MRALKAVLAAVCLASVALLVPAALGYGIHVVGDGAMDGTLSRGSLVLDEQVPRGELAVGDVVTLTPPGAADLVVRRVVAIDDEGVRTTGDATGGDPWVVPETGTERVALTVPALGWPLLALHSMSLPPWAPAGVAIGLAVLLVGLRRAGRGDDDGVPAVAAAAVQGVPARQPTPPVG
ncbi:hypothetical protein GCM10009623_08570 [Nocardioides aestuarii]